jgi:hypothetical protein
MGYGISIEGGVGNFQINSDTSNIGFRVVASGTSSDLPGTTAGLGGDKLFAIRYTPPSGTVKNLFVNKQVTPWTIVDENVTAVAVEWIELDLFPATPIASGYGIQIFNKDGDLAFDSQNILNNGATFKEFANAFTVSGDPSQAAGPLTPNLSEYATIAHSFIGSDTYSGYRFANNFFSQHGIYNLSYIIIDVFGSPAISYLPNLSDLFAIQTGSV